MASLMIYLALTACATTAVGVYAGPEMAAWADDWDWEWDDDDCRRSSEAGVVVAGGVAVGARSRSACERTSERDDCRRCDGRD